MTTKITATITPTNQPDVKVISFTQKTTTTTSPTTSPITLDFNDAEFLGLLVDNYIKTLSFPSLHIIELAKKLHGEAGC